jgi:signal peptidase II
MKINKWARAAIIFFILALNIGCDQVSKSMVRKDLQVDQVLYYVGGHFTLERTENTGAFLSLGDSLSGWVRDMLLVVLPLVAIVAALVYILIKTEMKNAILLAIILIIGGGVGNLYDRMAHGSVTDFMHIGFGSIAQTGVFNVADMSIMAGMFIILFNSFVKKKEEAMDESAIAEN